MNHAVRTQKQSEEATHHERLYSVKEVAAASGVSIRTLHVYDEMGLLTPLTRTEARYRLYGEQELLRLQQILFYKELGFSLHDIKSILDSPDFDLVSALEQHKKGLIERQERLHILLSTIDKTISYTTQGNTPMTQTQTQTMTMNVEELYEGLPKEFATEYRDEARTRWEKEVEHAENSLRAMSKADFNALRNRFQENWKMLATMSDNASIDAHSVDVQKRIVQHYAMTRAFWGTVQSSDTQAPQFKALGEMYIDDPRFTTIDGTAHPRMGVFLRDAMSFFVDNALAK
ncbi:MAG: MerR family transcriptional regulator [Candidatus Kapaibacterium sp.]|nr:MAG: MerR family transcriptional regulator [Candidatus Kapabacteria bacterium]